MANLKKIILVITDSRGVSQAFVTDDFQHLLLKEAIALVKRGILIGVHIVNGTRGTYIRSTITMPKQIISIAFQFQQVVYPRKSRILMTTRMCRSMPEHMERFRN
jgi:hypothetical protein